jgi:hypothetical protein
MTTTDVEVYDDTVEAEIVGAQPLTKREATALTKKISSLSDKVEKSRDQTIALFDQMKALVQQAKEGDVHKALGVKWNNWLADTVRVTGFERDDRKELATWLTGEGMSTRAIGRMLGVSAMTVSRDVDGEDVPDTVTSLDGAERPRNGKVQDDNVIDAEVVEEEEVSDEPMKAVDIVEAFGDEMANLVAAQGELSLLVQEDKWSGARKRVTTANLNNLGDVITALQAIVDDLMGDGS